MASHSHLSQIESRNGALNNGTRNFLSSTMEAVEVRTDRDAVNRNSRSKEPGLVVWNIFREVLISLVDILLEMLNERIHWSSVFEGLGITSRKSSMTSTDNRTGDDSWLPWKFVTDLFSHVIGYLLNSVTHERTMEIIAAESRGDNVS